MIAKGMWVSVLVILGCTVFVSAKERIDLNNPGAEDVPTAAEQAVAPQAPAPNDGPESRELLSRHETEAVYTGKNFHRCMGLTSLCPEKCGDSGEFADFTILRYIAYEKPGEYGDPQQQTYRIQCTDFHRKNILDEKRAAIISALKPGDVVLLSWQHDYVTRGGSKFPDRVVTRLEATDRTEEIPQGVQDREKLRQDLRRNMQFRSL